MLADNLWSPEKWLGTPDLFKSTHWSVPHHNESKKKIVALTNKDQIDIHLYLNQLKAQQQWVPFKVTQYSKWKGSCWSPLKKLDCLRLINTSLTNSFVSFLHTYLLDWASNFRFHSNNVPGSLDTFKLSS